MQHPQIALGIEVRIGQLAPSETWRNLCPVLNQPKRILLRARDPERAAESHDGESDGGDGSSQVAQASPSWTVFDPVFMKSSSPQELRTFNNSNYNLAIVMISTIGPAM